LGSMQNCTSFVTASVTGAKGSAEDASVRGQCNTITVSAMDRYTVIILKAAYVFIG
jgi:hypothetical protein